MLDYFAGRRFNLIDMTYTGAASALVWQGFWWWAAGAFVFGIVLSIAVEWMNGQHA